MPRSTVLAHGLLTVVVLNEIVLEGPKVQFQAPISLLCPYACLVLQKSIQPKAHYHLMKCRSTAPALIETVVSGSYVPYLGVY